MGAQVPHYTDAVRDFGTLRLSRCSLEISPQLDEWSSICSLDGGCRTWRWAGRQLRKWPCRKFWAICCLLAACV